MQNSASDDLQISANGTFAFATTVADGGAYAVTIRTQPTDPSQTCTVVAGEGAVAGANVENVQITCSTNTYAIHGTVAGLLGQGLTLENNGGEELAVAQDGAFEFVQPVKSGAGYAVTVTGQPTGPSQSCEVASGSGTVGAADVTDVTVTCTTRSFAVGGTVSGLAGGSLVLQNNGGDNRALTANGLFSFATPVLSGSPYAVTVLTQPIGPSQTCTVTAGTGTVVDADVVSVAINCTVDCNAATCPNGCCDGNQCRAGTTTGACGRGGETCAACGAGEICEGSTCVTGIGTCAVGANVCTNTGANVGCNGNPACFCIPSSGGNTRCARYYETGQGFLRPCSSDAECADLGPGAFCPQQFDSCGGVCSLPCN